MTNVVLQKLKCLRCGHEWLPRVPNVVLCPLCKSALWNEAKKTGGKNVVKGGDVDGGRKE